MKYYGIFIIATIFLTACGMTPTHSYLDPSGRWKVSSASSPALATWNITAHPSTKTIELDTAADPSTNSQVHTNGTYELSSTYPYKATIEHYKLGDPDSDITNCEYSGERVYTLKKVTKLIFTSQTAFTGTIETYLCTNGQFQKPTGWPVPQLSGTRL